MRQPNGAPYVAETLAKQRDRIAELEVAVRRGIAQIERLLPYVQWDGLDGEQDETNARVTLELMREAVGKQDKP